MKIRWIVFLAISTLAMLLAASCGLFGGLAEVTIDLGDGGARGLSPEEVLDYTLTVSGPGMEPISKSLSKNTYKVSLLVPAGKKRTFVLDVNLDTGFRNYSGAVLSFRGREVTDIIPNEKKHIRLRMVPGKTKLLVPDTYGNRVVQIDLFGDSYTNWKKLDLGILNAIDPVAWPIGAGAIVWPGDIDLDGKGRIFIANLNQSGIAAFNRIIRVDDINGNGLVQFPPSGGFDGPVYSIAVDKLRNILYFFYTSAKDPYSIWGLDLGGAAPSNYGQLNLQGEIPGQIQAAFGMDVDEDGILYVAAILSASPASYILKIDRTKPAGSRVVKTYSDQAVLSGPIDVVVKGDFVFVTNLTGPADYMILKLRRADLGLEGHAGTKQSVTAPDFLSPGYFFGPERFVSITNDGITLTDEGQYGMAAVFYVNELIRFDDLGFANWTTFAEVNDPFRFFDAN